MYYYIIVLYHAMNISLASATILIKLRMLCNSHSFNCNVNSEFQCHATKRCKN